MKKINSNYASVIARVLMPFNKLRGVNTYEGLVALYASYHDQLKDHRTLIIVRVSGEKNIAKVKNLIYSNTIMLSGCITRTKSRDYDHKELFSLSMNTSFMIIADNVEVIYYGAEYDFPEEERNKVIIRGEIIDKLSNIMMTFFTIDLNYPVANDNEDDFGYKRKIIAYSSNSYNMVDNFKCGDYVYVEAVFQTTYAYNGIRQDICIKKIKKEPKVPLSIC